MGMMQLSGLESLNDLAQDGTHAIQNACVGWKTKQSHCETKQTVYQAKHSLLSDCVRQVTTKAWRKNNLSNWASILPVQVAEQEIEMDRLILRDSQGTK